MDILFFNGRGRGWEPIRALGTLAAELLGGSFIEVPMRPLNRVDRIQAYLPVLGSRKSERLLVLAKRPDDLFSLAANTKIMNQYRQVNAWICDSFFPELLPPRFVSRKFTHIWRMSDQNNAAYCQRLGRPTGYLGFGSDVLGAKNDPDISTALHNADRDIDLLRVGRQPDEWADDAVTKQACTGLEIRFHGRPPFPQEKSDQQRDLRRFYLRSKLSVSHTNLVSPHGGTHRTIEYITARWTDAIANGCVVAGVQPRSDPAMDALLWPEAVLDFPNVSLSENLGRVKEYLADWNTQRSIALHHKALQRLDWRWRLKEMVDEIGLDAPKLTSEIARLSAQIDLIGATLRT